MVGCWEAGSSSVMELLSKRQSVSKGLGRPKKADIVIVSDPIYSHLFPTTVYALFTAHSRLTIRWNSTTLAAKAMPSCVMWLLSWTPLTRKSPRAWWRHCVSGNATLSHCRQRRKRCWKQYWPHQTCRAMYLKLWVKAWTVKTLQKNFIKLTCIYAHHKCARYDHVIQSSSP